MGGGKGPWTRISLSLLFLSLSLLIRKDKKCYLLITYVLSQDWLESSENDTACFREAALRMMNAKHYTETSTPILFFLEFCWFPCIYGNNGFSVFTVHTSLISLKCGPELRK